MKNRGTRWKWDCSDLKPNASKPLTRYELPPEVRCLEDFQVLVFDKRSSDANGFEFRIEKRAISDHHVYIRGKAA
jgi:hypothetical protein